MKLPVRAEPAHREPGDQPQPLDAELLRDQLVLQAHVVVQRHLREAAAFHGRRTVAWRRRQAVGEKIGQDDDVIDGLALHAFSEPSRFPPDRIVALVTQELEKLRA